MKTELFVGLSFAIAVMTGCSPEKKAQNTIADRALYSVRMAQSEMTRHPEGWMIENARQPHWGYTWGVVNKAMLDLWKYTGDKTYFDYAEGYADTIVMPEGKIRSYAYTSFNIDNINAGKILFDIYRETNKEKYKIAMDTLRKQMSEHPRTSEGGFWHKKRYPWQMWLDGLYMGSPFLAQYAKEFNEPALFDDVVNQVVLMSRHTYDPETGLFYHAWDEKHEQKWADKETGQSPNFWGRSVGWFGMALVDILDFIPQDHPQRPEVIEVIKKVAKGIVKFQDQESGVWYQVLDQGGREGNYLESSASTMFVYFLYKAVRNGYLDTAYLEAAGKGYKGILDKFIKENADGTISITNCCSVAGLGGNPYRDGSYEYYISEPVIENDPKATGPFIWASMEYEMANKRKDAI